MCSIYFNEYMHQVRRVYLNTQEHPENEAPSLMGHSYGWWEGQTLVVDTAKISPGPLTIRGIPSSDVLHVIERFTVGENGDRMVMEMVLEDPKHFEEPLIARRSYLRQPENVRIKPYDCIVREHL